MNAARRDRPRTRAGRDPGPRAGSIDSQSAQTTGVGGERSYDGTTKRNGRTRHLLIDT